MSNNDPQFDFTNEGDCILAGKEFSEKDNNQQQLLSDDAAWTLTLLDFLANPPDDVITHPDIQMTKEELESLKPYEKPKPKVRPYAKVIFTDERDHEKGKVIYKPGIEIGITGEF